MHRDLSGLVFMCPLLKQRKETQDTHTVLLGVK